jgi:hypothetical protein
MTDLDALCALHDAVEPVIGWDKGNGDDTTCCVLGRWIDGVLHIDQVAYGDEAAALIAGAEARAEKGEG